MSDSITKRDPDPRKFELAKGPSENYQTARGTLVYRLSELVFGSLLAAYILGFATFSGAATLAVNTSRILDLFSSANNLWSFFLTVSDVFMFAFISITYAYLTAAMYLRYHTGILTMPTAAIERSAYDFSIAVSQAILFGVSMRAPQGHFLAITIMLGVAGWRQNKEAKSLVDYFAQVLEKKAAVVPVSPRTAGERDDATRQLKDRVKKIITNSEMNGWGSINLKMRIGIGALVVVGILAVALPSIVSVSREWLGVIYMFACGILFGLVLNGTISTMKQGSRFIDDEDALKLLDDRYDKLEKQLLELAAK